MLLEKSQSAGEDLCWRIERRIAERTLSRVRYLEVERKENRVIVRGCTPSYFIKQLAIHAALEVLDPARMPLELEVQLSVLPRD